MASTSNSKRFIILGDAGAGKSSFVNFLYNFFNGTIECNEIFSEYPKVKLAIPCANWLDCLDEKYKGNDSERDINDQTQSQTQKCTIYSLEMKNIHLEMIDTPGFNDTNGTNVDEHNLTLIEQTLKGLPSINGIIIVVNGALSRLGVSFKNFLHLLHQVWPNDLLNNCVAILTNCDELSVNLDPSVLRNDLNVDKNRTFHFQNSLFRWDRKNQSSKTIRRFQQDFQDNLDKTDQLLGTLLQFNDVSTKAFKIGAIKVLVIEEYVFKSVQNIVNLLEAYKEQQIAQDGIKNAQYTMGSNKQWEKHREINAVRWVEVPQHKSSSSLQSQPKITRQSILSDSSTRSSQMFSSASSDRGLDTSKFSESGQEKLHPYPTNYDPSSPQSYATPSDNEYRYKQARNIVSCSSHHETSKYSSPKSKTSEKSTNYSSAYDSPSQSKKSDTISSSFKTVGSDSKMIADGSYNKLNLSRSLSGSNYESEKYSTKSKSGYLDNRVGFSSSNATSFHEPIYQQQETKIRVTIPDNEARSHHDYAQREEFNLQERTQELKHEQQVLSAKVMSLLQQLEQQVAELRSVYRNYDIIEKNRDLLLQFKEIIKYFGDNSELTRYYNETVNILSKK